MKQISLQDLDNIRDILIMWKLDIEGNEAKVLSRSHIKQTARYYGLDEDFHTHLYDPESSKSKDSK
jgi:hypothetical protein